MADSVATIKVFKYPQGVDNTQRNIILRGTISLSTGHYPVGGFPLTWTSAQNLNAGLNAAGAVGTEYIPSPYTNVQVDSARGNVTYLPTEVDVWSAANPPSGWSYFVDTTAGKLHIMCPSNGASGASGPMVEYGGNLITSQLNDVIQFCAVFPRADV